MPLGQLFKIVDQPLQTRFYRYIGFPFTLLLANNVLFQTLSLGGIEYVGKWTIWFFVYAFIIGLIFYFIGIVRLNKTVKAIQQTPNQQQVLPAKAATSFSAPALKFFLVFDLTFVVFISSMGWYCSTRLLSEIVDFSSFDEGFNLTSQNLFVWMFPNVLSVYFFLHAKTIKVLSTGSTSDLLTIGKLIDVFQTAGYYLIPVIAALVTFGQVIFPKIPFAVGGGQPRQVTIQMLDDKTFGEGKVYVLGESSQYLYLAVINNKESNAFQINKDEVQFVETAEKPKTN